MGRDRWAEDAARARRPSDVSRDRLARRIRHDVADVRVRLEEAVLRSDALLAAGQPDRAAEVLDEQHALLAELQDTIAATVAAAAVEAEAESVLFTSPDGVAVFGEPAPESVAPRRSLRATASAMASAVAVLALLIVAAPTPDPGTLAASDADRAGGTADGDASAPTAAGTSGLAGADTAADDATERAIGPNELEVRRLFTSPSPLPGDDGLRTGVGFPDLQALVDSFVASVVRAAGGLTADATPAVVADPVPLERSVPDLGDRPEPESAEPRTSSETRSEQPQQGSDAPQDSSSEEAPDEEGPDEERPFPLPEEGGNASTPGIPPLE